MAFYFKFKITDQLNAALNFVGDTFVFILNSLLKDCGYSNPN